MHNLTKIVLAGEGGQGVQSIADILAQAGNDEGKEVLYIPNFGIEQRGGVSLAYVQISDGPIGSPKFVLGDLVIALSERAIDRTSQYVGDGTTFVYDSSLIQPPEVADKAIGWQIYDTVAPEMQAKEESGQEKKYWAPLPGAKKTIGIPATDIARRQLHPRVFNMVVLGAAVAITEVVQRESVYEALEKKLGAKFAKNPELRDLNHRALEKGWQLALEKGGVGVG
jgi:2-oxoglutarate ferredoxin oxidoreductase subunit gamma